MELLSHGAMVERFERKKMAVKSKLNDLVDDLFAFMLSEVTTTTKTPPPPVLHPVMATSGGATITIVVPSTSTTSATSTTSSIPQQQPPTTTNQNKSSSAPVVVPPSGSGTISTASISANKNPAIGNGLQMGSYTIKSIKKIPTFTMLKPVSKPAAAHVAMKVKEEMCNEGEEEEEDDEEDEYDDDDEKAEIGQHHQTNIWSLTSFGALSNQPSGTTAQQGRSSALLQSSSQGSSGLNHQNHGSSNHQRHHQHHHNNHHHHHHHGHHPHHPRPHGSGFCDSDDESCECYDCMDESMVKVEMENDDDEDENNEEGDYSDSDNLGKHFFATSEGPKRKRQRMFEDRRARDKEEVKEEIDGSGIGGPSDPTENMEDLEEESESVSNNHQIDTVGLKCWFGECQAMLEDRAKLNQHLFFEHEKTLPYQCRVVGCGRQFDVRKDFWQHIRNGHADYTCSICSIKFNGYFPFITHEFQQHEEGIFRCSRVGCDFVAAIRDLVYKHAKTEHVKFVCTFAGCDATFECYSYLKRHRRIHSQVKPYCCKWPGCGYSSTQCGAVIQHIRIRHFRLPSSVKKQRELNIIDQRNPNDYLEVITELLN